VYTKEKTQLPFKGEYIIIMLQMAFDMPVEKQTDGARLPQTNCRKNRARLFLYCLFLWKFFTGTQ
jgi:hypothetical protein